MGLGNVFVFTNLFFLARPNAGIFSFLGEFFLRKDIYYDMGVTKIAFFVSLLLLLNIVETSSR